MSLFDLNPVESEQQYNNAALNPLNPSDIGARWYEGIGTGLVQGGKTAFYRDLFNVGKATKDEPTAERALTNLEQLKPNPETVGVVGQLMFGLTDTLGTLAYNFAGGNVTPQTLAQSAGTSYAGSQEALHIKEGMDPKTARNVAIVEGAGVGLGAVVPGNVAGGLVMRATSGAAINLAMGAGQRTLIQNELNKAGYAEMAKQYAPFDGVQSVTDMAIGAFFGGLLGERARPGVQPRRIMPSDIDTVLTQNNAAHVELGTAPGVPTDLATRQAHVDMVSQAIKDLQAGNPVQATADVTAGNFMENPGAVATRNEIADAVRGHLSDLEQLQVKLEERGLPGSPELYSVQPLDMPPLRMTAEMRGLIDRATRENLTSEQLINEMQGLLGKLEMRNEAKREVNPRVRNTLYIEERLTKAQRTGDLTPEQVGLAKWLLKKNPSIGNDLAISIRSGKDPSVAGQYLPLHRMVELFKGAKDPLTAAHEILHHTERMMPEDIQREIRKAWLEEVKRVRDVAERSGNENLSLYINDVIKANLGMEANAKNAMNAISQNLVNANAYALYNPSEFWAVKASQIVAERANEAWVQRAVQWVKELIEKVKDLIGIRSDASVIRGLDAVLKSEGYQSSVNLTDNYAPKFNVEAPGKGVAPENLNGFEPGLRVIVPIGKMKLPEKPLVLTGTNLKNAGRQIAAIDDILAKFPDADTSPTEWSKMMAYAMATNDVPVPPYRFLKDINGTGAFNSLSRLTSGQIADADHGFENARLFREAYVSKELDVETTGKLFLWSFLSRGVSPYTQEGLFIDAFPGIDQWVKKAAAGDLTEADFPAYEAWAKSVAPQGSGQPGAGATHNLNAFGKLFLFKMGQKDANGVSLLQKMHDMMEDPNMTGKDIRRWFIENTEGVGIDNKVVSFTLLVAGFPDVMVLDRVQIRQLWDDGRFGDRNLYDGSSEKRMVFDKKTGKEVEKSVQVAGSALSEITYGARGLLIYEAIERALAKRVENIYSALGRPQDASIGRYHWETWVADSQQEASHGTLDAILHDAKGDSAMISEVTAKEGEYGAYAYGARYGRDASGTPYFLYNTPTGGEYRFTVSAFRDFLDAVKSPANGVIPKPTAFKVDGVTKYKNFSVTEAGNAPWYEKPQVNKQALDELAKRYAGEPSAVQGAGAVRTPGAGEAVSDLAGRGPDPYAAEELMRQAPALTYIGEDGTMVSAARALARVDDEITTAQRDAQGYGAAVACALRG